MKKETRILLLEENTDDIARITRELKRSGISFSSNVVTNARAFRKALRTFGPDIVLSDYSRTSFSARDALKLLATASSRIPLLVVTGSIDEESAVACLKEGADDCVLKNRLKRLAPAIKNALAKKSAERHRQAAETALKESEARFHTMAEAVPCAIIILTDGAIRYANVAASELTGYRVEELLRMKFEKILHPDSRADFRKLPLRSANFGTIKRELKIVTRQKEIRWIDLALRHVLIDGIPSIVGSAYETTSLKRTVLSSQENEQRYRLLAENSTDLITRISKTGSILYASPICRSLLGYAPAELVGQSLFSFIPVSDRQRVRSSFTRLGRRGADLVQSHRMTRKDGSFVWLETTMKPIRGIKRGTQELVAVSRDISERKEAEETLAEASYVNQQIISSAGQGIVVFDHMLRYVVWNSFMESMTGMKAKEVLGKRAPDLFPHVRQFGTDKLIHKAFRGEPARSGDIRYTIPQTGRAGWQSIVYEPLRNSVGQIVGVIGTISEITHRKESEQKLRQSEERYRMFVEQSREAIWRLETNVPISVNLPVNEQVELIFRHAYLAESNDTMAREHGYATAAEIEGARIREIFSPAFPKNADFFREFVQSGYRLVDVESERSVQDGSIRYFRNNLVGIIEDGHFVRAWGVQRDITARFLANQRVRESEAELRALFAAMTDIVFVVDTDGKYIKIASTGTTLLSRPADQLLGKTFHDIFSREVADEFLSYVRNVVSTRKPMRFSYKLPLEGRIVWFSAVVTPMLEDTALWVARDITEQREAEVAIKKSEDRYRRYFEDDVSGIFVTDALGKIIDCNPTFLRLMGYESREEALAAPASLLYPSPEKKSEFLKRISREKRLFDYERELIRKDGKPIHVIGNISGEFDESGHFVGVRGYLYDITERKRLQEELFHAQRLESIGTLAGGIAHDFNNILGIIIGYASRMQKMYDPEKYSIDIESILRAARRGAGLVGQLLTFARKTAAVFEPVDINNVLEELSKLLYETFPRSIAISLNLEHGLPLIIADANQLHQAVLNLCVNSRDAMKSGGTLTLTTSLVRDIDLKERFPEAQNGPYLEIGVSDTGEGMSASTKDHIFEPFFSTKPGTGTGMGLSLVYGVVKGHNGFISFESDLDVGTSFSLYLPVPSWEKGPVAKEVAAEEEPLGGTETLLLVEDEDMLRDLLQTIFESKGYTVLTAADGVEAMEIFKEHADEIALVLTDMGLPRLGGWEAFQQMRAIKPTLRAIMASGYFNSSLKSEMLKAGAKDFVQKPYVPERILARVRQVIDAQ
ncbi:MAG: PAS domain S-box protein [Ignavibacteria bacterium]|nr:PAS domain S-box protein [Ignavibacteria bacterium]